MKIPDEPRHRDGNALAGTFAEVLGLDMTTAVLTCAGCGRSGRLAHSQVYGRGPGAVIRCGHCTAIMARIVRTPTDLWLDLRGSVSWRIPVAMDT